ncbi:MAG: hypothetical protein WKF84_28460 [Pyrinomonadaceae bacterium]
MLTPSAAADWPELVTLKAISDEGAVRLRHHKTQFGLLRISGQRVS